jgi:phosphohistidine phosphatase
MSTLYLVRHAAAEEARAGQSDEDRALTVEGTAKFRRAARGIVQWLRDAPPPLILTSPLLRARQTAEVLREAFDAAKIKTELRRTPALAPPGDLAALLKEARAQDTIAVAHDPFLSAWIGQLCFRAPGSVELKKGALAALELKPGAHAVLLHLLQPGILRQL